MRGRRVAAPELIEDIRSGMSKTELMTKHGLTDRGLQGVVTILVDANAISRSELYGELHQPEDAIPIDSVRHLRRALIDFETLAYDLTKPESQGQVRDITEDGVGLTGIDTAVDEIKTLVILGDPFGDVAPFELEAKCRWVSRQDGEDYAGFEILNISPEDLEELRKLIRMVTGTV